MIFVNVNLKLTFKGPGCRNKHLNFVDDVRSETFGFVSRSRLMRALDLLSGYHSSVEMEQTSFGSFLTNLSEFGEANVVSKNNSSIFII